MTISTVIFRYLTSPKQNVLGVVDANHINNIKLSRQTVHQDAHAAPHWPGMDKLSTEWSSDWQSVSHRKTNAESAWKKRTNALLNRYVWYDKIPQWFINIHCLSCDK